MIMSRQKDKDSLSNYNDILASLMSYFQSIDSCHEYLVFSILILSLLLGIDLFSNNGSMIKFILQSGTTTPNLPYRDSDRDFITNINLRHPGTSLGIIPCHSPLPHTHRILKGLGGNGDMCRVLIINKKAPPEAISQSLEYFSKPYRDS